jgi:hypothetical protein
VRPRKNEFATFTIAPFIAKTAALGRKAVKTAKTKQSNTRKAQFHDLLSPRAIEVSSFELK